MEAREVCVTMGHLGRPYMISGYTSFMMSKYICIHSLPYSSCLAFVLLSAVHKWETYQEVL